MGGSGIGCDCAPGVDWLDNHPPVFREVQPVLAVRAANAISTKKRFIGSPFEDCTSQTASERPDEFGVSIADIGGIIRKIQQIDRTRIEHEIQNATPITNQRAQEV